MFYDIKKAAVLGSGVMGAAIAAHLANAGLAVTLLDIVPPEPTAEENAAGLTLSDRAVRDRFVRSARDRMIQPRSTLLYEPSVIRRIRFGNLTDDLDLLRDADWVVEAVVENLAVKQNLLRNIESLLKPGVILSTNTSGISVNEIAEALPDGRRPHFLVTHFFNPPRTMKLLELVAGKSTDGQVFAVMRRFCEERLGKGVVVAKDTPGFIANRIGVYSLALVAAKAKEFGLTVEETDALTGSDIGRPNTGTFRLLDMIGLDTMLSVASYQRTHVADLAEREVLAVPEYLTRMQAAGLVGDKKKQGFYRKLDKEMQVLDLESLNYRPKQEPVIPGLATVKAAKTLPEKLALWLESTETAGRFVWEVLKRTLLFAGGLIPAIADDAAAVDDGMKWGYNWSVGPFELWDMIGVRSSVERMRREGETIPPFVAAMLSAGREKFYEGVKADEDRRKIAVTGLRQKQRRVLGNSDASLYDMDDGVACLVVHSPNSSLSQAVIDCIHAALPAVEENFLGLILASSGRNFCVGANLPMILGLAEAKDWQGLAALSDSFQKANMALKYCAKPVIAAPFAMTLGGGAEMVMHTACVLAQGETNLGLVETGVGLIPGAGGNKELYLRLTSGVQSESGVDLEAFTRKAFDTIFGAKVSTSALDAQRIGYLSETDGMVMGPDLQLFRCRQKIEWLAENMPMRTAGAPCRVSGGGLIAALKAELYNKRRGGFISEHDELIGGKLAHVLCGGAVRINSLVSEQQLLDLERECFVSLCGEAKTRERIQYMLKTRKPLRN